MERTNFSYTGPAGSSKFTKGRLEAEAAGNSWLENNCRLEIGVTDKVTVYTVENVQMYRPSLADWILGTTHPELFPV